MAKRKLDSIKAKAAAAPAVASPTPAAPVTEAEFSDDSKLELEDFLDESSTESSGGQRWWNSPLWRMLSVVVVLTVLYAASFELTHIDKVYSGVTADGISLAGLSRADAKQRLTQRIATYGGQVITITEGNTNLRIPVASLAPVYDAGRAADLAIAYGRQGDWKQQLWAKARSAFGRNTVISTVKTDPAKLTPYLTQLLEDTVTPVQNAQLAFNDNRAQVTPAKAGNRLDLGALGAAILERLATTSTDPIIAPVYQLAPTLDTAPLQAAVTQINDYVSSPITLEYSGTQREIDQGTIITWINVASKMSRPFMSTRKLEDLYPPAPTADLGLNQAAIAEYVTKLASGIDQTAQNAQLAMQDGLLSVVQASRNGVKLDQAAAVTAIHGSLTSSGERRVALKLSTTQADVNEQNLESLGIKEMISEGETYFPGSPSTRLINVRTGAKRYNGVVLKPGQTFSFGEILGDVGPAQGYVPELVILNNHEEKQYGGGLCQVSSTAFRAALAAGLPITERHNHSFAISYYTWPYSAPGVDATIYYPEVDFKFVNDTGHYILMQTIMNGYDLKFQFFGTKTKSGVLRGPSFISGTNDTTQPSHTVFYRDVLDLAGNVTKTDTFHTWYKSSKDFPITKEFN